jgi:hypothetical protein
VRWGAAARAAACAGAACALALAAASAALGAAPAALAADEPSDTATLDQLLQLFAARRHGHVTFSEVHEFAMLDRPLSSSGELLYDAPDRLEKRTLRPKAETLLLEHGVLTAQRGRRTLVLSLRDYPQVVPFVESIRATLAGDRAALERFFSLQLYGSLEQWTLRLTPTEATVARTVREIRIQGGRDAIRSVQITETDGDASVLTIGTEIDP